MTLISEEDVQAIATHTNNLRAVARDVRIALEGFDSASCSGRARSQIRGARSVGATAQHMRAATARCTTSTAAGTRPMACCLRRGLIMRCREACRTPPGGS